MPKRHDQADDAILARIMGQRRSVRDFSGEVPEKGDIEKIVHAGLMAPLGKYAVNGCAVGIPQATPPPNKFASIKDLSAFLTWVE
jgi:nitroreductase